MMVSPQLVTAALRIRNGAPSTAAPRAGGYPVGTTIYPISQVEGEVVAGNGAWFELDDNRFVWAGGCSPKAGGAPAVLPSAVARRPDGTLRALSPVAVEQVFGNFKYSEGGGGRIEIEKAWVKANITELKSPLLEHAGYDSITIHKKAKEPFARVFDAISTAGLEDIIRSCAGTWVPRHMGWNPMRKLSSHSWGIAIDLNVPWNGYGHVPAAFGTIGSLREIVGLFEAEGFAWGGYFQPLSLCDGMHFELARTDI